MIKIFLLFHSYDLFVIFFTNNYSLPLDNTHFILRTVRFILLSKYTTQAILQMENLFNLFLIKLADNYSTIIMWFNLHKFINNIKRDCQFG